MKKIIKVLTSALLLSLAMVFLPALNVHLNNGSGYSYAVTRYGYFSGSTGTMNSLYNSYSGPQQSRVYSITSPTLPLDSKTTTVIANVTFSSSGAPFNLYVKSPDGRLASRLISSSTQVTFDEFANERADGKWQVYIVTTSTNPMLPSTGSARLTFNYKYEQ